jgi:thiosulfate dehydrogenase (quinone) large subunit
MSCHSSESKGSHCHWAYAHVILRLWVGMRLLFAGLDKFREKGAVSFGFGNLEKNLKPINDLMLANTPLPSFMVGPYFYVLSFALILSGIACLLGIATRISLFIGGLIFVSLSLGLMLLPDDNAAVTLGVQVGLAALALVTYKPNKLSVDGLLMKKGCCDHSHGKAE